MTDTLPTVYVALAKARVELPAVGMDSKNDQQGWNYRSAEDLISAVGPVLARHGINLSVDYEIFGSREIKYGSGKSGIEITVLCHLTLIGPTGDAVTSTAYGVAMSAGSTALAAAQTMAYKQLLGQVLCAPYTDHDGLPEPDASAGYDYEPAPSTATMAPVPPEASRSRSKPRKPEPATDHAEPVSEALRSRVEAALSKVALLPEPEREAARERIKTAGYHRTDMTNTQALAVLAIANETTKTRASELPVLKTRAGIIGWPVELVGQVCEYIKNDAAQLRWLLDADEAGTITVWGNDDGIPVVVDVATDERLFLVDSRWVPQLPAALRSFADEDMQSWSLAKLRNAAQEANIPTDGTKPQLIERLKTLQ